MKIVINGEEKTVPEPLTVAGLLADLAIDEKRVVVERNLQIVSHDDFSRTSLQEGDRLEILNLVSGG